MQISREDLKEGVTCPHCEQYAKMYDRRILPSMLKQLAELRYRWLARGSAVHVTAIRTRGGDYAKLRFWDLIEEGNATGYWRPTKKGLDFLKGETSVRKFAHVYNNTLYGHGGPLVTAKEIATSGGFDLDELLARSTW